MIGRNEVHLYWSCLDDVPQEDLDHYYSLLCDAEKKRAGRFYFHRDRFIAAHGVLRVLLSACADVAPEKLKFKYDDRGKPGLENVNDGLKVCFNLSHSHKAALYGVCRDSRVGVDIEYIRPLSSMESIAGRYFSQTEFETIRSFPQDRQNEVFFQFWTAKEAYLKATGTGLSGLQQIEITPAGASPPEKTSHQDESGQSWAIYPVSAIPGYAAAVAIQGDASVMACRQWTGQITTPA